MARERTMRSLSIFALILALSAAPCFVPSEAAAQAGADRGKIALSTRGKFIDQRIAEFMEKNDVPGLTMAMVRPGTLYSQIRRLWPGEPGERRARLDKDDVEHRAAHAGLHRGRHLPAP